MMIALFLVDRVLNDDTVADVVVMVPDEHPKVEWARTRGITLAPDTYLTGGTEREILMNALRAAGFEVISVTAQTVLGDDDRVTIHQWVRS